MAGDGVGPMPVSTTLSSMTTDPPEATVRPRFVSRDQVLPAFARAPAIDAERFRADLDRFVSQDIEPRA
jgi:hypothetical protein